MEEQTQTVMEGNGQTESSEKRRRRGMRIRAHFKLPPRPPVPVRALWTYASPEEQERAHQSGVAILEYWMGRASKQEVAERLGTAPLRIWQLSQQALSGMVAGLLVQPKARKKEAQMALGTEEDPKVLKKRITQLEKELATASDLIKILREMPAHRQEQEVSKGSRKGEAPRGKKRGQTIPRCDQKSGGQMATGAG